jgi:hypothetical protein
MRGRRVLHSRYLASNVRQRDHRVGLGHLRHRVAAPPSVNLTGMAVSERTRKILWVTAGGRCSICRVQLVTERTETDDPAVFGEEAHIVAQGSAGPRAGQVADVDAYDNLILLCSKDHKRVDDQVAHYTVPRLRQIKRAHEQWIRSLGQYARAELTDGGETDREYVRRRAQEIRDGQRAEPVTAAREAESHLGAAQLAGENSQVGKVYLAAGRYRVIWLAWGQGSINVSHEGQHHGSALIRREIRDGQESGSGEEFLRIAEAGDHVFNVRANHLRWRISFSPL